MWSQAFQQCQLTQASPGQLAAKDILFSGQGRPGGYMPSMQLVYAPSWQATSMPLRCLSFHRLETQEAGYNFLLAE
jgi:hypothetical protein